MGFKPRRNALVFKKYKALVLKRYKALVQKLHKPMAFIMPNLLLCVNDTKLFVSKCNKKGICDEKKLRLAILSNFKCPEL
jgi:hypothetical protein